MTSLPESPPPAWHAMPASVCLERLHSREAGLAAAEIVERRRRFGSNLLPTKAPPGWAGLFLHQFASPLIALLLVAAAVSLALGELADAFFIAVVLVVNAVIGTVQEGRAERGALALGSLVRRQAVVRRDGGRSTVEAADLVPGDVVELESGAAIPADLRLLRAAELTADESLLTGESMPVEKHADAPVAAAAPLAERPTMLFAGTLLLRGRGAGVVVGIGARTEIGRIAGALAAADAAEPPLVLRLRRFGRSIAAVVVGAVLALAAFELLRGTPPAETFFVAVALAVSAIPEGLPIAITIALSIAARRMARRSVIVRLLPAVEGLGACTLVASDKTGTLTQNRLDVRSAWLPGFGRVDTGPESRPAEGRVRAALATLARAGALCNEATVEAAAEPAETGGHAEQGERIEKNWRATGDSVDAALLMLAARIGLDPSALVAARHGAATIPYESERRFAAIFAPADASMGGVGGTFPGAIVKGALETVLPMCGSETAGATEAARAMAEGGQRVLAIGAGPVAAADQAALRGLALVGLVGLIDPLRPEAAAAVRAAEEAGVRVCMVTGDHPVTALAIARPLGIAESPDDVVTGAEFAEAAADGARLRDLVAGRRVFARIEPLQKLRIVQALQEAGHFVAVTGDGVNDAPALSAAHIGVAMGQSGTDAARQAADLILADDNFASVVAGIFEGRVAYANIRKVIAFLLGTSAAEVLLFFFCAAAGLPLPLFALQLLWLNLVTDTIQHVALALEGPEADVMKRPPRRPDERLFDRRMIEQVALAGGVMALIGSLFFGALLAHGRSVEEARNLLLLLMVSFENAHVLNCRSERASILRAGFAGNRWIPVVILLTQAVHVSAFFVPGLRDVLGVAPVSVGEWLGILGLAALLVAAMEFYKRWRR